MFGYILVTVQYQLGICKEAVVEDSRIMYAVILITSIMVIDCILIFLSLVAQGEKCTPCLVNIHASGASEARNCLHPL